MFLEEKCFICKKSDHMSKNCSKWLIDDKIIEFKFLKKQMQNQAIKQIKKNFRLNFFSKKYAWNWFVLYQILLIIKRKKFYFIMSDN